MNELVSKSVEMKRMNAILTVRKTSVMAELVETRAVRGTLRGQLKAAERQVTSPITQLANAKLALEKLADGPSKTEAAL